MTNFKKLLTYSTAVLAIASLGACGDEIAEIKKPTIGDNPVRVDQNEGPKVVMSCTVKADSDDMYYLYKTSENKYFLADADDKEVKPLNFKYVDQSAGYFNYQEGDFGKDVDAGSVRHDTGTDIGYVALVTNSAARTLEVVKYEDKTETVKTGAIPESTLIEKTKVLFSSNNCVEGQQPDGTPFDNGKSIGQEIKEQLNQWVDNPVASKDAIGVIRALVEGK